MWIEIGLEQAVKFLKNKWDFFWNYKSYVKKLERECKYLELASDGVKHEVEEGKNNGCETEMEIEEWLKDVIEVTKEARDMQEKKKQKSCFRGSTIISPCTRYSIGKGAEEIVQTIGQLETIKSGFRRIYYRTAPGKVTGGSYRGIGSYYNIPSRDAMLKVINKALMDPAIKKVGVYGPSGVGKSTLLAQLREQVHTRSLNYDFDKVAMATVSRDPDLQKIQNDLAYSLGLKFDNEIDVTKKADRLQARLKQGDKIIIILDDIWKKLELSDLGIPQGNEKIKLLLTSRLEGTLKSEMDCGHNFELKPISKEEAIDLFKIIVGRQLQDESSLEIIDRAVEQCAYLPVNIIPLATKLKKSALSSWKTDIEKLMESNKLALNKLILEALKDEEAKEIILLCGRIGNQIIAIKDLLVYGMGLRLFQGIKSLGEGKEKLKTLLENLKSLCFLSDYRDDYIKIHDLMSDASLSLESKAQDSLVLRNKEELQDSLKNECVLNNCKSISLPFIDEITSGLPEILKCPELTMFLLCIDRDHQIQFHDSFFKETKKLQVLDFFNVSFTSLPSSIGNIEGLHTLKLDHCKIKDLKVIEKLKNLRVLTLRGSNIDRLPKEVGGLIDLRLLDLGRCFELKIIENGSLRGLVNLEELHLPENFQDWKAKGFDKASLEEFTGMSHLTGLSICIPNLNGLPHGFPFANLKRFKIVVNNWIKRFDYSTDEKGVGKINPRCINEPSRQSATKSSEDYLIEYDKTRTLKLKMDVCERKIFLEDWVQTALQSAQKLELRHFMGHEKSITELSKQSFSELKHIIVEESPGIQYVLRPKDRFSSAILESLHLKRLRNLESIYDGNLLTSSFINLKVLKIKACHKLQNLFSPSLAKGLSQIEEIEVIYCNNLSDIVACDGVGPTLMGREKRKWASKFELLVFKGLRKLILSELTIFSSFCAKESNVKGEQDRIFLDGRQVSILSLESLTLSGLPQLRKISEGKCPVKLQSLQLLEVKSCENLSNVLENNLQLKNLEVLSIEKCASIETIFDLKKPSQGEAIKSEDLAKLITLKLVELENLKTIWPKNNKEGLLGHNLNQLEVSNCKNLTHLFSPSMVKSLQKISQIYIDHCDNMETIVTGGNDGDGIEDTIKFSSLTELKISDMGCLSKFASGNCSFNFPCLKKLELHDCPKMSTFVRGKASSCIKNLITRACPGSKAQPAEQHDGGDECQPFFSTMVILPSLEKLVLSSLRCFTHLWQSIAFEDSFCKLESIEIKECHSLQILVSPKHGQQGLKEMKNPLREQVLRFPFLTNIKIDKCDKLRSLFPDAIARTLFELENLHISSCKELEIVVSTQEEEMMMFNKLHSLKLERLQELKGFSKGSIEYYFPFLQELWISGCTNFESFITGHNLSTDANVKSIPLFHDKVIIPNLEKLHIKGLGLEKLLHDDFAPRLFCKLKELEVEACDKLSNVIPSFILPSMQSLESLTVKHCKSMGVIFEFQEHTAKILENLQKLTVENCESLVQVVDFKYGQHCSIRGTNKIILRQLSFLKLSSLEKLSCFCSRLITEWPSLVKMEIGGCNAVEAFAVDSEQHLNALFLLEKVAFPKMESLKISNMLSMKELWSIDEEGIDSECSSEAFFELKRLEIQTCGSLKTIFPSKMLRGFSKLEELTVTECNSLEQVFQVQGFGRGTECSNNNSSIKIPFSLMSLDMLSLPAMKHVWNAENSDGIYLAFEVLRSVVVSDCGSLKHLFPAPIARSLGQIDYIIIQDCKDMEEIVQGKDCSIDDDHDDREHHQFAPNLKLNRLSLWDLPKLKSFILCDCEDMVIIRCPNAKVHASSPVEKVYTPSSSLKELYTDMGGLQEIQFLNGLANLSSLHIRDSDDAEIKRFPWKNLFEHHHNLETLGFIGCSVEAFGMEEVLDIVQHLHIGHCGSLKHLFEAPTSFRNLASIYVRHCYGMEYLLTSSVARCLKQLSHLQVEYCRQMREIVREEQEQDGNGGGVDEICFPRLQILKLYKLNKLESFCSSTSCSFQFPRLESVILGEAGKLKTFCEGDFSAPLLHKIYTFQVLQEIMKTNEIKQKKILDKDAFEDIFRLS